jgi:DNA-binding NtrC family response regulator
VQRASPTSEPAALPLHILVADDEHTILDEVGAALRERGHHVTTACDGRQALEYLSARRFDLLITDARLPGVDGFGILRILRSEGWETDVVVITGYATVSDAVTAMKEEAADYLAKPFEMEELMLRVTTVAARKTATAGEAAREPAGVAHELIGHTTAMIRLRERIAAIAESEATVLITGDSGTGKEVAARTIHRTGPRREQPFVAVNCAAFPDTLIESELFGHVRGAFTGAIRDRKGRLATADGGTLFLDEIGEMSMPSQAKLLRVLEDGTFCPLGSDSAVTVDLRILSATNQDLRKRIEQGRFREDLYFRLKVLEIQMPSLAARRGDIPLLVEHFLRRHVGGRGPIPRLSPRVFAALAQYPFPGNVRELEHAVQHALVLARGEDIRHEHLPEDIRYGDQQPITAAMRSPIPLSLAVEAFEREYIRRALVMAEGNRSKAAAVLGISRKHLWQKIRDYGIAERDLLTS